MHDGKYYFAILWFSIFARKITCCGWTWDRTFQHKLKGERSWAPPADQSSDPAQECFTSKNSIWWKIKNWLRSKVIFVPTTQPDVAYFFRAGVLFSIENAKFWPILTNLGYFVANLRTFWCTGLNNVAVYQNGQISGMAAISFGVLAFLTLCCISVFLWFECLYQN